MKMGHRLCVGVVVCGNDDEMMGKLEGFDEEVTAVESYFRWVRRITNTPIVDKTDLLTLGIK